MIRLRRMVLAAALIIAIVAILISLDYFFPPNLTRFQDVSRELRTETEQLVHVFQTKDEKWRLQAKFEDIDPLYIALLIHREDHYFWYHYGVNPLSFLRAAYQGLSQGKVVSGGSTLTMQVARLLEPRPRTLKAKILQIVQALQLEWRHSKKEILEIYLTLAPYGSNLEGTRSAALAYFGKSGSHLLPSEAALLVALPQTPSLWKRSGFLPRTQNIRNRVLTQAFKEGIIDDATYRAALQDPLPDSRFSFPREMPHVARRLCSLPQTPIVSYCSLRPLLQKRMESIAFEAVKLLPPNVNVAMLVAHHPSRQVIAYVGSTNFFDNSRQGQVDFIRAFRSPGSTLKPFIYALGFDYGLLKPTSYMLDDRRRFGSYLPDNFDKTFCGMVTVRDALVWSLNIPVVELLNEIGPQRFLGVLEEAGITPKFSDPHAAPGLSLALGGVGMTLEQLVTLYASLPQNGHIVPLRFSIDKSLHQPYQLISSKSAGQITEILSQTLNNELGQKMTDIAVKTGTSYGHRDAWAVGYNAEYVAGVWIGHPDGTPFGVGTGRTLAVPVLEQVFRFLPTEKKLSIHTDQSEKLKVVDSQETSLTKNKKLHKQFPKMLFPVDATVIESFSEGEPHPIIFSAMGGKRPYTWLVDGKPFATHVWSLKTPWKPEKPGFYEICLLDAQGLSESANIEVQ
ncbi:MAG: penicillin-binding protein 1C [Alphaproteobacteria bacterium]|nr:penicillin-binding protein 1C [Alphaproteobacteria bacterium]